MTLHKDIKVVLIEVSKPLEAREIADIINQKKIYHRGNGRRLRFGSPGCFAR